MPALSLTEQRKIEEAVRGKVLCSTASRLYFSKDGESWEYSGITGPVAIIASGPSYYLQFFEEVLGGKYVVNFNQELYKNLVYEAPAPFFHTYEMDEGVVGLSFSDEEDAIQLLKVIQTCVQKMNLNLPLPPGPPPPPPPRTDLLVDITEISKPPPPPPRIELTPSSVPIKPTSPAPVPHTVPQLIITESIESPNVQQSIERPTSPLPPPPTQRPVPSFGSSSTNTTAQLKPIPQPPPKLTEKESKKHHRKKTQRRRSRIGAFFSRLTGHHHHEEEEVTIGTPTNFRHDSHIGFNPKQGGIDVRNIPPEWKKLFAEAGIKKRDFRDEATAAIIYNTVAEVLGTEEMKEQAPIPPSPTSAGVHPVTTLPSPPPLSTKPSLAITQTQPTEEPFLPPPPPPRDFQTLPPPPPPPRQPSYPPPLPPTYLPPLPPPPVPAAHIPPPPPPPRTHTVEGLPQLPPREEPSTSAPAHQDLLSEIQTKQLRKAEPKPLPDLSTVDKEKSTSLVDLLAKKIGERRGEMQLEGEEEEGEEEEDDSSEEWA